MRYIVVFVLFLHIALASLVAEYRMDNCHVDSNAIFVDASGNGYDAVSHLVGVESNKTLGGIMCYAGDFTHVPASDSSDEDDDYVVVPSGVLDGKTDFTITLWVKTTQNVSTLVSAVNGDTTYNELWLYIRNGSQMWLYLQDRRKRLDFGKNIADGIWHFIALTRSISFWGSRVKLYLDGEEVDSGWILFNKDPLYVKGLVLGQDQDSVLGRFQISQELNGYMDEVKFFDSALDSDAIEEIFRNEKALRNWDGTERICCCDIEVDASLLTPLQMQSGWVEIKNSYDDPVWTHVSFQKPFSSRPVVFMVANNKGGDPASIRIKNVTTQGFDVVIAEPQGRDGPHIAQRVGFLAINEGVHQLDGHIIEVGRVNTTKIQGTFAQGDKGWEEVKTKVTFCEPAVLANIQTMNNEINPVPRKPSKPWMTAVVSVDNKTKNLYFALDRSETYDGEVDEAETIGYIVSNADFAGSFVDSTGRSILFEIQKRSKYFVGWDNECRKVNFLHNYSQTPIAIGWKDSRYGNNGGWFRICSIDSASVGFVVDEDTAQDGERWHIPEDGAIYAFSDAFVIDEIKEERSFRFDAIDTFRDINDRNISTKIVNKKFSLTIISLDYNATGYQEFNGTVCVQIVDHDHNDTNVTGWTKLQLSDQNSSLWQNIVVDRAIKRAKVKIAWKEEVNESCPLGNEDNQTLSSDSFAIRPLRFTLQLPSIAYAKDDFNFSAKAFDNNNNPTKDYNETYNDSFTIDAKETKLGCLNGTLAVTQFQFKDGQASGIDANYTEIGDINITLKEINGSEFAQIDADDTNDSMRLIEPVSQILRVKPYKIAIQEVNVSTSIGKDWLYIIKDGNISEMNLTVGARVQALDKDGGLLEDFNATCYSEDLHVQFWYDEDLTANTHPIGVKYVGTISDDTALLSDCNKSILFPKSLFHAGEGYRAYAFDINSTFYQPLSPIQLRLQKATITENTLSKVVENSENIDKNITFYYASLHVKDLYTSKEDDNTTVKVLVYDKAASPYTHGWKELIIDWYLMQKDDMSQIALSKITEDFDYDSVQISDMATTFLPEINGTRSIGISNPSKHPNAFLHLNIPMWLWYSANKKATFAKDQSCAHHPCIHYRYFDVSDDRSSVQSGEVSGVDFEQNVSQRKRGLKVFR